MSESLVMSSVVYQNSSLCAMSREIKFYVQEEKGSVMSSEVREGDNMTVRAE